MVAALILVSTVVAMFSGISMFAMGYGFLAAMGAYVTTGFLTSLLLLAVCVVMREIASRREDATVALGVQPAAAASSSSF